MTRQEICNYNQAQIDQILIYKWIESEKKECDIGFNQAAREWIAKYGHSFRLNWLSQKPNV